MADTNEAPFSNEVALRIGLAARALPDIGAGELIEAIQDKVGDTITEESLNQITVGYLRQAFGQAADVDGDEENEQEVRRADMAGLKVAVAILWGQIPEEADVPNIEEPIDEEGAVTIAVASNSGELLNAHFGSASRYLVYQVTPTQVRLVAVRSAAAAEVSGDKNGTRVKLISDCKILYCVHIGGPASAKVIRADIHLIQVPQGGEARELLRNLQKVLAGSPPPWLAKAMGAHRQNLEEKLRDIA